MKVYIITSGSYSDYGIECAFTDKELAELAMNELDKRDKNKGFMIEEYDLNPDIKEI